MKNIRSDYNFKRNNTILEDYLANGVSYSDLAKKYKLTRQRIASIIKDMTKKGFTNRLPSNAKLKSREIYKNKATEIREAGNLDFAVKMFKEISLWDKNNKNYRGLVDVLGHLRITYSRLAEQSSKKTSKDFMQKALNAVEEAGEIISKYPEIVGKGQKYITKVHQASTLLMLATCEEKSKDKQTLKKALKIVNEAIKNLPGTDAHKAWTLRLKGEILFNLGELENAVKTLLLGERLIFTAYDQEFKNDDQSEIKLNVWLSGIHLTMAKIAARTNRKILANHYAASVISIKDPQNVLGERKKEAKRILKELGI